MYWGVVVSGVLVRGSVWCTDWCVVGVVYWCVVVGGVLVRGSGWCTGAW